MLSILRFLLTVGLAGGLVQVVRSADPNVPEGDLWCATWLAFCVVVGLLVAVAWYPLFRRRGRTGTEKLLADGFYVVHEGWLMGLIKSFERGGSRRLVRWLCFVEGIRHPWLPAQFVIGMQNAKPGSRLERLYAGEVYRFNSEKHSVQAYEVLIRHGIRPPAHPNAEIQLRLKSLELEAARKSNVVMPLPDPPLSDSTDDNGAEPKV